MRSYSRLPLLHPFPSPPTTIKFALIQQKPQPGVVLVAIRSRPTVDELVDGGSAAERILIVVERVEVDLHLHW